MLSSIAAGSVELPGTAEAIVAQPAARRAPGPWLWGVAGVTYAAGVAGYWQYRPPGSGSGDSTWHLLYYALQLFALEFNEVPGEPVPPLLQVVRVVAPAVTFLAAAFAIVGERVRLWLRRNLRPRGYTLVIGDTAEPGAQKIFGDTVRYELLCRRHYNLGELGS